VWPGSCTEGVISATFEFEADTTGCTEPYSISWYFGDGGGGGNEETFLLTFNEAVAALILELPPLTLLLKLALILQKLPSRDNQHMRH
jgi:hypothetical protein